ncbi:lactonase family protein [Wenyingzhuangia sp. IMCC45574]
MLKNFSLFLVVVTLLTSCSSTKLNTNNSSDYNFFIGTMKSKEQPVTKGIYHASVNTKGVFGAMSLAATIDNPIFLHQTEGSKYLLSSNASGEGSIYSYKIEGNKLSFINNVTTGRGPCFVNQKGRNVLTANYSGGSISLHSIDENGKVSNLLDTQKHTITTPSTHRRQKRPFAHSCYFEPNSDNIIAADLGANKILFSTIKGNKLVANEFSELEMPANSGPRHIAFHPNKPILYVVNELNATVSVVKKNTKENTYKIIQNRQTLPKDFTGKNTSAHIVVSNDGKFLYMTNRGHDSISLFEINEDGKLIFVERVSVHGEHPRNFALTPDNKFVLIANRDTNNICSFKRNQRTGKLTFIEEIKIPKPVYILFH